MPTDDLTALRAKAEQCAKRHETLADDPCAVGTERETASIIRRLLAALPTWRSIETAPKDGTPILVHDEGWVGIADFDRVCWYDAEGRVMTVPPTLWMPLPTPPVEPKP